MEKISVCLSKGGTGKTTTAVNLAAALALKGFKILLVDADTQGQAAKMLGVSPGKGLAEVITEDLKPMDAIVKARPDLFLLAGGKGLAEVKRSISQMQTEGESVFKKALMGLRGWDFIIFDTSPGWDAITVNVLFYVSDILCPVSMEPLTIDGLMSFNENIKPIKKYNHKLKIKYILPTFLDGRVRKSKDIHRQLKKHFESIVCDPIRYNVKLSEAPAYGQTIFEYSPRSAGAADYKNLAERIK